MGRVAKVVEVSKEDSGLVVGKVELDGANWNALFEDCSGSLEVGSEVKIRAIDGITLLVTNQ
jgi:membrane protein implicated in regulation of membrane protease activity